MGKAPRTPKARTPRSIGEIISSKKNLNKFVNEKVKHGRRKYATKEQLGITRREVDAMSQHEHPKLKNTFATQTALDALKKDLQNQHKNALGGLERKYQHAFKNLSKNMKGQSEEMIRREVAKLKEQHSNETRQMQEQHREEIRRLTAQTSAEGGSALGRRMSELRALRDRGEISREEYEELKRAELGLKTTTTSSDVAEKKGSAKFAEDTGNIAKGIGNIANFFNANMFGNMLVIVVLILLIWIVIQFFGFV